MEKFIAFNFPRAAMLDFIASNGCHYCLEAEGLLDETIGQPLHVIKSKMAARGKFKGHKLFHLLLLLNVISPLSCKKNLEIRHHFKQFNVNFKLVARVEVPFIDFLYVVKGKDGDLPSWINEAKTTIRRAKSEMRITTVTPGLNPLELSFRLVN